MPYRIAFLSKYPPIEGGIAAKTYWLARGLAKRGHEVHVITHEPSAAGEYRISGSEQEPDVLSNIHIHRIAEEIPWHIPDDKEYAICLLDLAQKVIKDHDIQIIDSGYLIPYGIVGHQLKLITNVPHVIRHGGSDIEKFYKQQVLGTVFENAIANADMIISNKYYEDIFRGAGVRVISQPPYIPDTEAFSPVDKHEIKNRLAYIRKVNYYWQHKSLHLIADIMRQITGQFECWFTGQGNGMTDLRQSLGPETVASFKWRPFVKPWEMPQLLNQLDGIFIFESGLPHTVVSNLALEAICSGVGIITDRVDFAGTYQDIVKMDKNQVIVVSPSKPSLAVEMIEQWVRERAHIAPLPQQLISYQEYLSANEAIYANILSGH